MQAPALPDVLASKLQPLVASLQCSAAKTGFRHVHRTPDGHFAVCRPVQGRRRALGVYASAGDAVAVAAASYVDASLRDAKAGRAWVASVRDSPDAALAWTLAPNRDWVTRPYPLMMPCEEEEEAEEETPRKRPADEAQATRKRRATAAIRGRPSCGPLPEALTRRLMPVVEGLRDFSVKSGFRHVVCFRGGVCFQMQRFLDGALRHLGTYAERDDAVAVAAATYVDASLVDAQRAGAWLDAVAASAEGAAAWVACARWDAVAAPALSKGGRKLKHLSPCAPAWPRRRAACEDDIGAVATWLAGMRDDEEA
jgi:hypothetical protein